MKYPFPWLHRDLGKELLGTSEMEPFTTFLFPSMPAEVTWELSFEKCHSHVILKSQ